MPISSCTSSRVRSSRPRARIGVVTHGQGLWWLQVTLTGKESHTGSTPMPMRKNAGLGGAGSPNSSSDGDGQPAGGGRRHRPCRRLSEFAQRHPRQGRLHHRHPLAGPRNPRRHEGADRGGSAEVRRRARSSASRSSRSAISTRSSSTTTASRRCATPPSVSAIAPGTSSRAPAMTPAGSTVSPRPR